MNSVPDESLPLGDPPLKEHRPMALYLFRYSDRDRTRFRTQFLMALWRHLKETN